MLAGEYLPVAAGSASREAFTQPDRVRKSGCVLRDQADLHPVQPAQQLAELGDRARQVIQTADDQARGVSGGQALQHVGQAGAVQRPALARGLAVADELDEAQLVVLAAAALDR